MAGGTVTIVHEKVEDLIGSIRKLEETLTDSAAAGEAPAITKSLRQLHADMLDLEAATVAFCVRPEAVSENRCVRCFANVDCRACMRCECRVSSSPFGVECMWDRVKVDDR